MDFILFDFSFLFAVTAWICLDRGGGDDGDHYEMVRVQRRPNTSKAKRWTWTLNNYSDSEVAGIEVLVRQLKVKYICYGKEVAPVTGTPHLQGYLEGINRLRLTQVTRLIPRAHFEVSNGTPVENRTYCAKDNEFNEHGEISGGQGKRTDLVDLHKDLQSGTKLSKISNDHFSNFIRYQRGIQAYRYVNSTRRSEETKISVYYGPTGTGKTRHALAQAVAQVGDISNVWISPPGKLQWWDGYDGEKAIILDEFSGSTCDIKLLLRLADRVPLQLPVKGGFTQFNASRIYITSNLPVSQWYSNAHPEHIAALMRRVEVGDDEVFFNSLTWGRLHPEQ